MKKLYFSILSAIVACGISNAQTLTQANSAPAIGDMFSTKQCDSTTANPGGNGTNQMWNFSSVAIHQSVVSNYTCVTVASTGSASTYPSANVAVKLSSTNNSFYDSNAGYLKYYGGNINIGSVGVIVGYSSAALYENFPYTFGSTANSSVAGTVTVLGNNGNFTGTCTTSGAGTGTIVLPGGNTLTNVLKVTISQAMSFTVLSSPGTINQVRYDYYHASQKSPVYSIVTASVNSIAGSSTQTFVTVNSAVVLGVNELSNEISNFGVYPNPASSNINVTFSNQNGDNATCEIINALGQTIKTENIGNDKGTIVRNMNIEGLGSGFYFVKVNVGNKSKTQKITIQ
ncbi:MAG: T9SS type A sorting domain-containing protein [Bacteroidia bacterium]